MNRPVKVDMAKAKAVVPLAAGSPPARAKKIGVLLVNLGTPDGTDFWPMWRYLREFLSDPRVIELNKAIWYPILYGLVLTTRPKKSGANYRKIWNREKDESPLRTFTRSQSEKLAATFAGSPEIVVDWGMRYGSPSIRSIVERMEAQGCDRVLTVPLYPQYSATTTATANDKLFRALMKMRRAPAVRSVPRLLRRAGLYRRAGAVDRTAPCDARFRAGGGPCLLPRHPEALFRIAAILTASHCQKTTRLLRERLGWDEKKLTTTFQSRFGAQEWLQPYTDKTVERLAREGVKSIAVVNPGFSSDCIETLEEIAGEAAEIFHHAGGKNFSHIPCLNDSEDGMAVIEALVRRELAGWV